MNQGLTVNGVLFAIATFIIGSWVAPKMEWISNTVRVWIFAFGVGLAIYALLNITSQNWLNKWIPNNTAMMTVIVAVSLLAFAGTGVFIGKAERKHEGIDNLKVELDSLIVDIGYFVADSQLNKPEMPTTTNEQDVERWMEANREHTALLNIRFVDRFHQRLVDIGYKLHPYISDDDWKHYSWIIQPDHPVFPWIIDALMNYRSQLEGK